MTIIKQTGVQSSGHMKNLRDIPLAPLYGCVRIGIKAPAVPLMSHIREQRAKARKFLHEGRKRVQFTSLCVRVKLTLEI